MSWSELPDELVAMIYTFAYNAGDTRLRNVEHRTRVISNEALLARIAQRAEHIPPWGCHHAWFQWLEEIYARNPYYFAPSVYAAAPFAERTRHGGLFSPQHIREYCRESQASALIMLRMVCLLRINPHTFTHNNLDCMVHACRSGWRKVVQAYTSMPYYAQKKHFAVALLLKAAPDADMVRLLLDTAPAGAFLGTPADRRRLIRRLLLDEQALS